MTTFDAEFPFIGYRAYLRISNSNKSNSKGRRIIGLYSRNKNPKRLTMSYARYLLCLKEKRILSRNEQADHKDGNKTNDNLNNLQILTPTENNKKRVTEHGISRMMVKLICPTCDNVFTIEKNQSFISKQGYYTTCGRKCMYLALRLTKGLSKKQLKDIGKKQVISIFRKEDLNKQK